jgi:hypothetical protein
MHNDGAMAESLVTKRLRDNTAGVTERPQCYPGAGAAFALSLLLGHSLEFEPSLEDVEAGVDAANRVRWAMMGGAEW